jgi:hypothetical protein
VAVARFCRAQCGVRGVRTGRVGGGDESSRLREVAGDPAFREAVTWQNPAALSNAVDKVAAGKSSQGSVKRRREETVASYWQRYCAKNDTIGFLGALAWGTIVDAGPALASRSVALVRERSVHLEAWGVQALAEVIDPALEIPSGKLWAIRDFYGNLWTQAQQKAASRSPHAPHLLLAPAGSWHPDSSRSPQGGPRPARRRGRDHEHHHARLAHATGESRRAALDELAMLIAGAGPGREQGVTMGVPGADMDLFFQLACT